MANCWFDMQANESGGPTNLMLRELRLPLGISRQELDRVFADLSPEHEIEFLLQKRQPSRFREIYGSRPARDYRKRGGRGGNQLVREPG
jgi:hypothetical protein